MEDVDSITNWGTEEWKMFESLRIREFIHTRVYDVNLLESMGMDIELPSILCAIRWVKLYDEPRLGSCLLALKFIKTFDLFVRHRKSYVCFRVLGRRYEFTYPQFSELMNFSSSCLPESQAMLNFDRLEFSDEISRKNARIRFSDIHNPSLRF
jgi:hypothetical protein